MSNAELIGWAVVSQKADSGKHLVRVPHDMAVTAKAEAETRAMELRSKAEAGERIYLAETWIRP